MDSRQVYRGLDIGTGKVDLIDRARVRHHGLDLVTADQRYGAGRFAHEARQWIQDIAARGRVPVLVGGTGFFLRALAEPLFPEPPLDPQRRANLTRVLEDWSVADLSRAVEGNDPERAALAREGGRHRLMRTLEVAWLTGRPLTWWHRQPLEPVGVELDIVTVVLEVPREVLDRAIEARVRAMFEAGLVEEVGRLLSQGYRPGRAPGMTTTGYREVVGMLDGELTEQGAEEAMAAKTRQYARRQMTWFRTQVTDAPRVDATMSLPDQVNQVLGLWEGAGT